MSLHLLDRPASWVLFGCQNREDSLAVVIDVLRATSTIVTALASGVDQIYPLSEIQEAWDHKKKYPDHFLAGEREGKKPEGFDFGNSPLEFIQGDLHGVSLVMTTTNGTRAIHAARSAKEVVIGSFLNEAAVIQKIRSWDGPVFLFCAGTGEDFSLEDALVASSMIDQIEPDHPWASLYRSNRMDMPRVFCESKNGRRLLTLHLEKDIEWALQKNRYPILPFFNPTTGSISLKR